MRRTGQVRAVLFDLDGVLVDTKGLHNRALRMALDQHGFGNVPGPVGPDELSTEKKLLNMGFAPDNCGDMPWDTFLAVVRMCKASQFHRLFAREAIYNQHLHFDLMLAAAKSGVVAIALCTNNALDATNIMLGKMRVTTTFNFVMTSSHAAAQKPAPDIYLAAQKKLNEYHLWRKDRGYNHITVYEDSDQGCEAARAAGITDVRQVTYSEMMKRIEKCDL